MNGNFHPVPELMENYTSFDTPHPFPSGVELSSHFIYIITTLMASLGWQLQTVQI